MVFISRRARHAKFEALGFQMCNMDEDLVFSPTIGFGLRHVNRKPKVLLSRSFKFINVKKHITVL